MAKNRGLPLVDCMMVSPWHDIGEWLEVESGVNGKVKRCRVTDVAVGEDLQRHMRTRLVELDWPSAKELCDITKVGERPPRDCPVTIIEIEGE